MKTRHTVGLSLVVGAMLGAAAVQGLYAQAQPPVYWIGDISEVTDPATWNALVERSDASAAALLKDFEGQYLARTEVITALDGTPPKRIIIIRFPSVKNAKGWYNSAAQAKVNETRMESTKSRSFIVQGM